MDFKNFIREVEDFPKEGIGFKDVTTLLQDPSAFKKSIDACKDLVKDLDFDIVIGPEARGFIIGAPLAYSMEKGFVPVRKPGKLPFTTKTIEYDLEYGTDKLEIHIDAVKKGQKVK